ncbi:olfactory receptor 1L8-like [Branchiostoma floridae]|uniref:Olfactory receptor 1L8-like n=1 Tax=Branchiostoma floridae TaxID=7739 RepID=A0A9J7HUE0_BRAFL|nr:olfactory receptor 1L8-like [Branchiostoma floridae]
MEKETDDPSEEDNNNRGILSLAIGSTFRDLQTTYLAISWVLSVGCGLLLLFLVWKKQHLQRPSNYLRCNLAIDDIIFTSCLIPIRIYALFRQDASGDHLWCSAKAVVGPVCLLSMFGTYLMMAIDLYYFVCDPLHYHDKITTKRVAVWTVTIRAFSLFFGLGPVAFSGLPKYGLPCEIEAANSVSSAAIFRNLNMLALFLVALFTPILYYRVFREARRQQERDENRDLWIFQTKAFKTMVPHAIVWTVFVSTMILLVAMGRALISKEQMENHGLIIANHVANILFLTLSSMANPIIYSFRLPEFRRAIKELCGLPTTTPPAVPAGRPGDMEMAAITAPGQVEAEDLPFDQAPRQTTRGDVSPGSVPSIEYRAYEAALKRPLKLTVRADVHAEPTALSGQDITETLPGQLNLEV